jgi:hypothetical protein
MDKEALWSSCATLQEDDVLDALHATPFLTLCDQIYEMTQLLGPALAFAGKHLHGVVCKTREYVAEYQRSNHVRFPHLGPSLTAMVTVTPVSTMHDAGSMRHCVSRLIWLLDFTEGFVTNMVSAKFEDDTLVACARAAYEDRLAMNHKWFVRNAVRLALYACPSRARFRERVTDSELVQLQALLQKPVAHLYNFLQKQQLTLAVVDERV